MGHFLVQHIFSIWYNVQYAYRYNVDGMHAIIFFLDEHLMGLQKEFRLHINCYSKNKTHSNITAMKIMIKY